jgi:hypothetical protein
VDVADVHDAYVRAYAWAPAPDAPRGYRLVWMRGDEIGMCDLPAGGGAYAILGRHTHCDVVLPNDGTLALRHLLARTVRLEDGALALRLFDLRTSQGFFLDDDVERRAIVATGPLAVRVGRYVLVALPMGTGGALPRDLPEPEIHDAPRVPTTLSRGPAITHVTTIPPAPLLDEAAAAASRTGSGRVRLTLRREGRGASVVLDDASLEAGVLLGRADKCLDGGLRAVMTETISRVHLLLLREHGAAHAFDLASTQGTYAGGRSVRRVALPDGGASLVLAATEPLLFEWHAQR